jgi:hypothetical protein
VGHIIYIEDKRGAQKVWWGNLRERDHLEHPGIDGWIILILIFRKWDRGAWPGLIRTGARVL